MNWMINSPTIEFINTRTGRTSDDTPSRLCKLSLFKKFTDCFSLFGNLDSSVAKSISYKAYKESALRYQETKNVLYATLEKSGRGKWIRVANELDMFFLSDGDSVKSAGQSN